MLSNDSRDDILVPIKQTFDTFDEIDAIGGMFQKPGAKNCCVFNTLKIH